MTTLEIVLFSALVLLFVFYVGNSKRLADSESLKHYYERMYESHHNYLLHLHDEYQDDSETSACDVAARISGKIWGGTG